MSASDNEPWRKAFRAWAISTGGDVESAFRAGWEARAGKRTTPDERERRQRAVWQLYESGLKQRTIAQRLGLKESVVSRDVQLWHAQRVAAALEDSD